MKTLEFKGPYVFVGDEFTNVLLSPDAGKPGIYLWAVKLPEGYLTYYVGETGKSFFERLSVHITSYLSGNYRIYDPVEFSKGNKVLKWKGTWQLENKNDLPLFLKEYQTWAPIIYQFLATLKVFLAPLEIEDRKRKRIESAIAKGFADQRAQIGQFQEAEIRYAIRHPDEESLEFELVNPEPILGLPKSIKA